jgi:hypothetical protein
MSSISPLPIASAELLPQKPVPVGILCSPGNSVKGQRLCLTSRISGQSTELLSCAHPKAAILERSTHLLVHQGGNREGNGL